MVSTATDGLTTTTHRYPRGWIALQHKQGQPANAFPRLPGDKGKAGEPAPLEDFRTLYMADTFAAMPADGLILFAPDEAFADLLLDPDLHAEIGAIASTCNAGGEILRETLDATDLEPLRGRTVAILSATDERGVGWAEKAARLLRGIAASVRVVRPPDSRAPDWRGWLQAHGSYPELVRLCTASPEWEPEAMKPGLFHPTDLGNAERFAFFHRHNLKHCDPTQSWYIWNGRRWEEDAERRIEVWAKQTARRIYRESDEATDKSLRQELSRHAVKTESAQRIRAMIDLSRSEPGIPITPDQLDADPWLLNCGNGTLHLKSGELRPHRREDLITKIVGTDYDADATFPMWDEFIERSTEGDSELAGYLRQALGYSLCGSYREELLFFIYGPASSGKSTFIEAAKVALGAYAMTADFHTFLRRDFSNPSGPSSDLARLAGSRMVISVETDRGKKLAEGMIKLYTGGDTLVARKAYQAEFEFLSRGKLWLVANDAPRLSAEDEALWRRIRRVPFNCTVPESERDPAVKETLTQDPEARRAILAWAVRGFHEWIEAGKLATPAAVRESTDAYRAEVDALADFLEECCTVEVGNPELWIPTGELWTRYKAWAEDAGIKRSLTKRRFGDSLKAHGIMADKGGKGLRIWRGLGLGGS